MNFVTSLQKTPEPMLYLLVFDHTRSEKKRVFVSSHDEGMEHRDLLVEKMEFGNSDLSFQFSDLDRSRYCSIRKWENFLCSKSFSNGVVTC